MSNDAEGAGESTNSSEMGVDPDRLWQAADSLRGSIDSSEYKHVVLGLIFLKYISDAFEVRRSELEAELKAEGIEPDSHLEDRDEYAAENVFWVPPEARWVTLQAQARQPDIAGLLDDALHAIERENPKLRGKLPRDYARRGLAAERLGALIDQISTLAVGTDEARTKDVLGRIYEYFLARFAAAEGKLGGEFFTPSSVVRLLVEMIEPFEGRVYDPCCGSGGMFVQSEEFAEAHGGGHREISIYGQESNPTTWRLAHMNLAIRGIEANLGEQPADTFIQDLHPDLKADYILANPPFNVSSWSRAVVAGDARWKYGLPPAANANFAWVQHFIHHLAPPNGRGGGTAGFVMANSSLSSISGGEGAIRRQIVEADLVDCIVALPSQLFLTTGIPVCLWFVTRDKSGRHLRNGGRDRSGETLFIDARNLGYMQTRTLRVLSGVNGYPSDPSSDIGRIVAAYHAWRGESGAGDYADQEGFCKSAGLAEIASHDHILTPGRYVGAAVVASQNLPFHERVASLSVQLQSQFEEAKLLEEQIAQQLEVLKRAT